MAQGCVRVGPRRELAAMKCQKCTKAATLHITEVLTEEQVEELHLCEDCAQKYLYEPPMPGKAGKAGTSQHGEEVDEPAVMNRECMYCGTKFVDFRNSGRLRSEERRVGKE